uniref:Uncharacterized protein n=1 Tax=Vespula pensylvanica TaxID=30213 RepID=A0A834P2R5_VESPE|nr:hypothetical protein H0235_008173 [Vespula pensylvanica]
MALVALRPRSFLRCELKARRKRKKQENKTLVTKKETVVQKCRSMWSTLLRDPRKKYLKNENLYLDVMSMDGENFCCFEILWCLRRPQECMPVRDASSKRAKGVKGCFFWELARTTLL